MSDKEYPDLNSVYPLPPQNIPVPEAPEYPTLDEAYNTSATMQQRQNNLPSQDLISKIYHPIITGAAQGIAGLGAGALALPETGPGAALAAYAAGSAMYPPAEQFANSIDAMRGVKSPESSGILDDLKTGAEIEAGGKVLGAAIGAAAPHIKGAIIKGISSVFGPSTDAINAWLENPSLPNSPDVVDLARKLPDTLNNLKGLITQASDRAADFLSNSPNPAAGAIDKEAVLDLIGDQANALKTDGHVIGSANQAAMRHLEDIGNSINNFQSDYIPETSIKNLMKALDANINFDDKGVSATNTVLANIRGGLNRILKSGNTEYSDAMDEVSKMMKTLDDAQTHFGITNHIGQGLKPTDRTISALQNVTKDTKSISRDVLNDLSHFTGDDYVQHAQNAKYAKEFTKGFTNGSRKVNLSGIVGGGVGSLAGYVSGHPIFGAQAGATAGALAGAASDTYGGPMAAFSANLLNALSRHVPMETAKEIVANVLASGTTQTASQGNRQ